MAVDGERASRGSSGSRRSAIAAVASALAAMALAAAVAGRSCQVDDDTPEAAVRNFAAAASADDREAIYELLGPETRRRLEIAAKRATDLVGGSKRYDPLDMISIGKSIDAPPPRDFAVKARSDSRAIVEILGAMGERSQVTVVNVNGHWRIEIPAYGSSL